MNTTPESRERPMQTTDQVRSVLESEIAADEGTIRARALRQARVRRIQVNAGRALLGILVVGGWQLFAQWKIIDPFFFGQPSGIVRQLADWFQHGTSFGSIWSQIGVTMEEALLGFVYGVLGDMIRLQPANAAMKPIWAPGRDVQIQGRLLAVLRKYR